MRLSWVSQNDTKEDAGRVVFSGQRRGDERMSADSLPPGAAALLVEIETGRLSEGTRATLARALRAAADGRPIAEILAADARNRRDAALAAMRREHFASLPPSGAAKAMAAVLRRPPAAGMLRLSCRSVLDACGDAPSWRTILRALPRHPEAVTNGSGPQEGMDHEKC